MSNETDRAVSFVSMMVVLIVAIMALLAMVNWSVATVKAPPDAVARWMDKIIETGNLLAWGFVALAFFLVSALVAGVIVFVVYKFRQQRIELARVNRPAQAAPQYPAIDGGASRLSLPWGTGQQQDDRVIPLDVREWRQSPNVSQWSQPPDYEDKDHQNR